MQQTILPRFMMFRFEKLEVWQKSIEFVDQIYSYTKSFPDSEKFGLTSQVRRASVSITSNIAEGRGRISDRDFAHFLQLAYGSLMEVLSQVEIAFRQSYIDKDSRNALFLQGEEVSRMLSGLRKSLGA